MFRVTRVEITLTPDGCINRRGHLLAHATATLDGGLLLGGLEIILDRIDRDDLALVFTAEACPVSDEAANLIRAAVFAGYREAVGKRVRAVRAEIATYSIGH
jgi:hypothetical protein